MASKFENSFNAVFNSMFEMLEPINVGKVKTPRFEIKEIEELGVDEQPYHVEEPVQQVQDAITCEVKVVPAVKKIAKIDVKGHATVEDKPVKSIVEDKQINEICTELTNIGMTFTNVKRMPTGLIETMLILNNGTTAVISIDADGKLYNDGVKIFFIGRINPIDEYKVPAFKFTAEAIKAVFNGQQIPEKYYVPVEHSALNRMLDFRTLKETDKKKRDSVLVKAGKVFAQMNDDIVKAANGEPYRFAITKYKSADQFSMVSSKRNVISNLAENKLMTEKEIWLEINGKDVTLTTK